MHSTLTEPAIVIIIRAVQTLKTQKTIKYMKLLFQKNNCFNFTPSKFYYSLHPYKFEACDNFKTRYSFI